MACSRSRHRFTRSTTTLPTQSPRGDSRYQSHIPQFTLPEMPPTPKSFSPRDLSLQRMDEQLWRELEAPPPWREEEETFDQAVQEWREEKARREKLKSQMMSLEGRLADEQKLQVKLQGELENPRAMFGRSQYREVGVGGKWDRSVRLRSCGRFWRRREVICKRYVFVGVKLWGWEQGVCWGDEETQIAD